MTFPPAISLQTDRLILSPLVPEDAREMVGVLSSDAIYTFTGGHPPSLAQLEARYAAQIAGPPSSNEVWRNWILRWLESGAAIGLVQATIEAGSADVAWVVAPEWQGRGLATEAVRAISRWLADNGVKQLAAHIHPDHVASQRVATQLGLADTGEVDDDGEAIWVN